MNGEELVVGIGAQEFMNRRGEMEANREREDAGGKEEQERRDDVIETDVVIVDRGKVLPALGRTPDPLELLDLVVGTRGGRETVVEAGVEPALLRHFKLSSHVAIAVVSSACSMS